MFWTKIMTDSELYNYEYLSRPDVCRLCWSENAEQIIGTTENSENLSEYFLVEIIKYFLQIEIDEMVHNKVCDNCYNEIKRFHSFKTFCQETDAKLRSILQKGRSESEINELSSNTVKTEDINDELDKIDEIDNYLDDTLAYDEAEAEKPLKTSKTKSIKYVTPKRSPTYCRVCRLDLETIEKLSQHNSEHHGIETDGTRTMFRCFGCEKRFRTRQSRISHEIHFCKGLKDGYKCNICERFLPRRRMYEQHMGDHRNNITPKLPEEIFKCSKCTEIFKTKELWKNHMVGHTPGNKFVCDICGRMFSRHDYLYKHKLTHSGMKQHQCPHCEFKATQRSSLTVHIRKHTGERPYFCDLCPQRCISSSNLRAHRRRHLGVKQYECTICNKKFGYKISLEEHVTSAHVRSESHPCEHCGATYTRIRGLRRHLAAKHRKQAKKTVEQDILVQVTNTDGAKIDILKEVEYEVESVELKDGNNVLLLKHQDGDVYMV
ncbi:zinc finger protein 260-like isoform X1 [Trichoplusia ni]|uniref:Zinc finger protein 260-like isoform X1 n=2 Tax=Trichoplusia ni TaxID=7111 RepID=A0A7E5X1F3_TRINI|nr:zinc finger protein 260-like isoform X1 [Trichoplusia ni]